DLLAGQLAGRSGLDLLEVGADLVCLGAPAADDDARARGVDVDPHTLPRTLDLDPADGGVRQQVPEVLADLRVLQHVVAVLAAFCEPARPPVGDHAEPEPVRVDLVTHYDAPSSVSGSFLSLPVSALP